MDVCAPNVAQMRPLYTFAATPGLRAKRPIVDNTRSTLKLRRCATERSLWRLQVLMLCPRTRHCLLGFLLGM